MIKRRIITILVIALAVTLIPLGVTAAENNENDDSTDSINTVSATTTNHSDITNFNVWISRFLTDSLTYDYRVNFPKRNQEETGDFTITQDISSYTGGATPRGILLFDKNKKNWWAYIYKDKGEIKTSIKAFAYYRNSTNDPYTYAGMIEGGTNKPYEQLAIYPKKGSGSDSGITMITNKLTMDNDALFGDFTSGNTFRGSVILDNIRMDGQEINLDFFWDTTSYSNLNLVALIYM